MGGMLTQPVTTKRSGTGEGLGLRYGLSSMQGWRSEMEDAHDVKIGLRYGLDDWSFFAVFDGHAGKRAAMFAAWNLLEYILRDSQFKLSTENCSRQVFLDPEDFLCFADDDDPLWGPNCSNNGDKASKVKTRKTSDRSIDSESGSESKQTATNTPPKETQDSAQSKKLEDEVGEEIDEKPSKPKFASFPVLKQLDMVKDAIKSGFLKFDERMRASTSDMSGCTAVCTFVSPTHLFIANCGDSRAVLYDGSSPKFVTEDHKPFNPKERRRIIDAGGSATQRINGTLAVSRALGDFEFKKDNHRGPCEQLVSPEPEVTVIERHPQDEFLILACDGIWDVMDNDDLCQYVRYLLTVEPSLEEVCSSVLDLCLNKGSRDNMSIIIVVFESGPKFSQSECEREQKNDQILIEIAESMDFTGLMDFAEFLLFLKPILNERTTSILPPGGGIEGKYDLLKAIFDRNSCKKESE